MHVVLDSQLIGKKCSVRGAEYMHLDNKLDLSQYGDFVDHMCPVESSHVQDYQPRIRFSNQDRNRTKFASKNYQISAEITCNTLSSKINAQSMLSGYYIPFVHL